MKLLVSMGFAVLACFPLYATAQQQQSEPLVYIARQKPPAVVLKEVAAMFGKRVVGLQLPDQPVSGRFEAKSIESVLNRFATAYQFDWFIHGGTIYLYSPTDWSTRKIHVGEATANVDWKEQLTAAGLYYPNFSFMYRPDDYQLVVSGPQSYIKLVEYAFGRSKEQAKKIEQAKQQKAEEEIQDLQTMVFKLKHASVVDRDIKLRDKTLRSPGALSVLRSLLGIQTAVAEPGFRDTQANNARQNVLGMAAALGGLGALPPAPASPGFLSSAEVGSPNTQGGSSSRPNRPATDNVVPQVNNFTTTSGVNITADPRTNSILIRDSKKKYDHYKTLMDQLDVPVAMIEIEAMMVDVNMRNINELGVEFSVRGNRANYDFPGVSAGANPTLPESFGVGATSVVDPRVFLARLKALTGDQNAKVLARPTILTQDNVAAYIDLTQTVYLQVSGERVAEVVPVTAGSLLQVMPRIVEEGKERKVFLQVDIQDGALSDRRGIALPSVENTSLSTQALIEQDKAILIGGYNRETSDTEDFRVPGIGRVPVLGRLFRSEQARTQRVARLFLIIPRLVEIPGQGSWGNQQAMNELKKSFNIIPYNNGDPTPSQLRQDRLLDTSRILDRRSGDGS